METIKFYINGIQVKEPKNYQELAIQLNYDRDNPDVQVAVTEWDLFAENAEEANNYIEAGLTGGVGIFEGLPMRIDVDDEVLFDGYLDFTDAEISCDRVIAKSYERKNIDWLNDVADGFTFEYLYNIGVITDADFVYVPYIINTVPNYREAILMLISLFVLTNELKNQLQTLVEFLVSVVNPFEFTAIIRVVLRIAYIVLLIFTIIKMVIDIFLLIIQPVKYHAGMKVATMIERACDFLDLQFESSILQQSPYNQLVILPPKYQLPENGDKRGILGFLQPKPQQKGYYPITFGQLLRDLKDIFNAKVVIIDGKLYFERVDWAISTPSYTLPDVEIESHTTNANELISNYVLQWDYDVNDKNTLQHYIGQIGQFKTEPKTFINKDLVLMKNVKEIRFPYAWGIRKETLTLPEKVFDLLFKGINIVISGIVKVINLIINKANKVIKLINKLVKIMKNLGLKLNVNLKPIKPINPPTLDQLIENRIGMLMIENDFITVPKMIIVDNNGKLPDNYKEPLHVVSLWDDFHSINSFVPSTNRPNANQYKVYYVPKVKFCLEDWQMFKKNRYFYYNGKIAELIDLKWNVAEQVAEIRFKVNELYTNNLQLKIMLPDGQ